VFWWRKNEPPELRRQELRHDLRGDGPGPKPGPLVWIFVVAVFLILPAILAYVFHLWHV